MRCTSSNESARDLSTPSTRLVGHWGDNQGGTSEHALELYISEVDEDGNGSCILWISAGAYNLEEDFTIFGNYEIISENGSNLTLSCFEGDVGNDFFDGTFEITEDGQSLIQVEGLPLHFKYIDSKTEPSQSEFPPTEPPATTEPPLLEAVPTEEVSTESFMSESTRDLSTPSTRLIGHWGYFVESEEFDNLGLEWYFGIIDDEGVGSAVGKFMDATTHARYRVLSESGDTVTISLFHINTITQQESLWRTDNFNVSPDGESFTMGNTEYQYIDSRIEP